MSGGLAEKIIKQYMTGPRLFPSGMECWKLGTDGGDAGISMFACSVARRQPIHGRDPS